MIVELVTRREDLEALSGRWDELALRDTRDGFFRTSAWYRTWMEHIQPRAQPAVIVVRDGTQRIVGLAPLCRTSYRDLGFRFDALSLAGRDVVSGDFLDFIAEAETRPQVTSLILKAVWEMRSRWGLLVMGEILEGSECCRAAESFGVETGLVIRRQEERICPYIALPASFEEYLNTLGSSTRYHIRRRVRDVEKKGARVEVYSRPEDISFHLDTLIRLHLTRWRKDNLPGTLGRPGFAAFLRKVCNTPPAGSSCRLYLLAYQDTPVAALLTFYFGQSALYYQAGWDPDSPLASFSPAVVVMARSIQDAIENGLRYYEFLRGDEAYKSRWTKTSRKTVTLLVARRFMAREYLRAAGIKDQVKHFLIRRRRAGLLEHGADEPSDDQRTANPTRGSHPFSGSEAGWHPERSR